MRLREIQPNVIKPKTPQQLRLDNLMNQKDSVSKQIKAERDRQKVAKAQQTIQSVQTNTTLP